MVWWSIIIIVTLFVSFFGTVIYTLNKHSNKHLEAQKVRETFNKNGAYQIWQENIDKTTFHYIIQMDDGTFGDWIVRNSKGTNYEKTVFIPKDGSLKSIHVWLKLKAKKI